MKKYFCYILGSILLLAGCSPSLEDAYKECKIQLEEERLEARKNGNYSYSHKSYINCIRPFREQAWLEEILE